MNSFPRGERLSEGARSRLDYYISDFAAEIVSEAGRLNPDEVVTSRDITDAHAQIHARRRDGLFAAPPILIGPPELRGNVLIPLMSGVLSLVAAVLLLMVVLFPNSTSGSHSVMMIAAIFSAYAAAGLSVAWAYLSHMRKRLERTRAVRYAELGGRDAKFAYYLAEVLSSSKPDDDTFITARFVMKWARLEDRIRRMAIEALGMSEEMAEDYPIGPLLADFTRIGVLDQKRGDEFAQILDIRNRLAHGGRASDGGVRVGLDYMDVLEEFLDERIQNHALQYGSTAD